MALTVTPLGAGRQVGRSCILLEIGGRRVLLDCGISPGRSANDPDHFPELDALVARGPAISEFLDAVIISHCHTDHVGALPYLTEVLGYRGPLLMSSPTRAIAPCLVKDYLRLSDRGGGQNWSRFKAADIDACFARATCMRLRERVIVKDIAITSYYAGHVLGAVMVLVECRGRSALYTGDFTMVPDHYLSATEVPLSLRPDVMITESTCCTTIRSSKRSRELDLCRKIQETLERGGRVLMPVFMIGRAQEMCLLCEKHWERARLNFPIYVVRGMAETALNFFRLFPSWASDRVRNSEDPFNFKYVKLCDVDDFITSDAPMVIFAGPAMLQGGPSLRLFRRIAPERKNLLVFAGYCLPGTIGNEVQAGLKIVQVDEDTPVEVRCSVDYMSHSDHTDSRGITQLISQVIPRRVVLVHGGDKIMDVFQPIVQRRLGVPCDVPAVGETLVLEAPERPAEATSVDPAHGGDDRGAFGCEVLVSPALLLRASPVPPPPMPVVNLKLEAPPPCFPPCSNFTGVLVQRKRGAEEAFELRDALRPGLEGIGLRPHSIRFRHESPQPLPLLALKEAWARLRLELQARHERMLWTPFEPPALAGSWSSTAPPASTEDGNAATPNEGEFRLQLLSDSSVTLRLAAGAGAGAAGAQESALVARAVVDWSRHDEVLCTPLADFVERLEDIATEDIAAASTEVR